MSYTHKGFFFTFDCLFRLVLRLRQSNDHQRRPEKKQVKNQIFNQNFYNESVSDCIFLRRVRFRINFFLQSASLKSIRFRSIKILNCQFFVGPFVDF